VSESTEENYGYQDTSFKAAGEFEGIRRLVDCFYDVMEQLPEAQMIRKMHPADLSSSRDKLTRFLCGWLGGPRYYMEKYGSINIPQAHKHFKIGEQERDAWLLCMDKAVAQQPYKPTFKVYLMQQLSIPAERVRVMSEGKI
jgi:hemoglobin